jgi:peptide/nickel transport system substrate-binding protein
VVSLLTVAALLAACAPAESTADGKAANGTFVYARTGDIDQLDPHKALAFQDYETLGLVYERLVEVDNAGKLAPGLAKEWKTTADGLTVTFTLRADAKFTAGGTFTSADAKATLEHILDEKTASVARSNLVKIKSVDTPDASTVVLHLASPHAALLYALTAVSASMVRAADLGAGTLTKTPNGTGPFAWKSWDQGQRVVLTGRDDYWGGAPDIKTLEFRVIPSESSILAGMRAGTFQVGQISDPLVAKQGENAKDYSLTRVPALGYHVLMLNGRKGPLKDLRVRQAISCALDRQEVIDTANNGDGKVTGPITSPAYQYSATDGLPCTAPDLKLAKQLLADAGYANGFTLRTIVGTEEYATALAEGQSVQSQLAKIGVKLDLQQLVTTPYVEAWLKADFDAAIALNGGSYDPFLMYSRYYTEGGSLAKPGGLDSKALSDLLNKGNATTAEDARQTIFGDLQKQLLKESPWVWMFRGDNYYFVTNKANGFAPHADLSLFSLADVRLGG